MICDTLQHLTRYKGLCKNLDTAIDYLLTHDPASLPLGRTEVDGEEVFINTMDATLHSDDGYHPEYHKSTPTCSSTSPAARAGALPRIPAGRSAILPATVVFRTAPVS